MHALFKQTDQIEYKKQARKLLYNLFRFLHLVFYKLLDSS